MDGFIAGAKRTDLKLTQLYPINRGVYGDPEFLPTKRERFAGTYAGITK